MSVWLCLPSARPAERANLSLSKWRERGYKIALWRDSLENAPICDVLLAGEYPGYARAVNAIAHEVLRRDKGCDWIVTGGDDTEPDPDHAPEDIALDCTEHFGGTFGVMQPTGDRWAGGSIDRICGSPWIGRDFCERIYGGNGPLWSEFSHMFVDQHLQEVALKLGVLWQRRDLTHLHRHCLRTELDGVDWERGLEPHLVKWNSQTHWNESKSLFERLKAGGFAEAAF